MIKMLFSDLDGTLLLWDNMMSKGVSPENKAAIDRLIQSGVRFGIATGRSCSFLPRVFDSKMIYDTVGMCGSMVVCNGKTLYHADFDHDEIESLLDVFSDNRYENRFMIATKENDYIFANPQGRAAQEFIRNEKGYVRDYRAVLPMTIKDYIAKESTAHACACFCWFNSEEGVDYYKDMLKRKFDQRYQIVQSSPHSVVIMKDDANKGTGIAKVAFELGLSFNEIAVVGDSENDIEMFAMIPHSFCMDHSRPDIMNKARYRVHSVAECIDRIIAMNQAEVLDNEES